MERHRGKAGLRCGRLPPCRFPLIPRNILGRPESTATSPPSSTSSGPSETVSSGPRETTNGFDGGGKTGSRNMVGPIIGGETRCLIPEFVSSCNNPTGVVGGVAGLAILVIGIIIARRRYVASQRPPSTLHGPQGTSPYRTVPVPHSPASVGYGTDPSMAQKLYVGSTTATSY